MDNSKEVSEGGALLERIKRVILKKSAGEEPPSEDSSSVPEEPSVAERKPVNVPANSLLFSLWYESTHAVRKDNGMKGEGDGLIPEFELILEETDQLALPLTPEEAEAEKYRAIVHLMMKARSRWHTTRPDVSGKEPSVDADVCIYVAKNRLVAWAFAFPPAGEGKKLERFQLEEALKGASVCEGIQEGQLDYIVREQPFFRLVPVACGTPMVPGEDGRLEEKYEREPERMFGTDQYGNLDYHIQNNIQNIHAGDVICKVCLPTKGKDGRDVLGNVIPERAGKTVRIPMGQNTSLNEDGTELKADVDGRLRYEGGKFCIRPVIRVSGDVDFHVGNIDFLGDVYITGSICEGFSVKAEGTISVGGVVERAFVEAGRDVVVSRGILGNDSTVVKAGGSVFAKYFENCVVYAGEDIHAGAVLSSYLYSDRSIFVRSNRGTVIGGKLVAAVSIEAEVIGCQAERITTLIVGERPYVQQQKDSILLTLKELEGERERVEKNLCFLDRMDEVSSEKLHKIASGRLRHSNLESEESRLKKQLEELGETALDVSKCRIRAGTIYPTVRVSMGEFSRTISERISMCDIHVSEDELLLR